MGSMDSAFGGRNSVGSFEPDDFYESFLAPKFHDFTAPEEPIDPDEYFMTKPGMLKQAFATVEEVKTAAPKIHKAATLEAPKPAAAAHQQAPPKSPVAAEKAAVSAGSAKKSTRAVTTSLTPLTSKSLKNGNSAPNSPALPPMLEKNSNGSLKPASLAKKLQASENDDPNAPTNNAPDVAAPKPAKPALTRQRSVKAQEDKPALTRQRSQKLVETKPAPVAVEAHVVRKVSGESNASKSSSDKESDASKAKANTAACKEPAANPPEAKNAPSSPYSGHHCKSSRCAANDANFSSPMPTKKYLVAKRGTPGSLRKATPNQCNEEAASETASDADASKVQAPAKVALEEVFRKMALDQSVAKEEVSMTELSKSEVEDLKEVPLGEDRSAQALSAADVRAWAGRSVDLEENAASSERSTTECANEEPKATGIEKFLQVASECLENIDLNKLDLPQSKQGKKRKSGELMPAGASKRANCTSDDTRNKAVSKKISQVKEAAASKIPKQLRMRRLSVAKRLSIARAGSRVTNPRPFRLRTQERGAVKEKEFIKKVEEYKASKEGFHSAFQGLAVAEPKIPGKLLKSGHVFSAKRADTKAKDDKEVEAKATKPGIPPAQKAPLFDHPFKPHRSTKKLTVPQEPKFHTVRGSRTCASHMVAVPAA